MQLLSSFYRGGDWGSERMWLTQASLRHARIWMEVFRFHSIIAKSDDQKRLAPSWLCTDPDWSPVFIQLRKGCRQMKSPFVPFVFVLRCLWLNSLISLAVKAVLRKMGLNCCGFWVLDWMSETFAITGNSVTLDLLSVPRSRTPQQCDLAPGSPSASFGIYLNALPQWFP